MDSNAMYVAAPTISLHSASRKDGERPADRLHTEVTTLPREARASIMDATSATLPAGTAINAPAVALPIVLPVAPPTAQPIVHHPSNLTNTITMPHPIGTPRLVLR